MSSSYFLQMTVKLLLNSVSFAFLSRVSTLTRDIDILILSVCLSVRNAAVNTP